MRREGRARGAGKDSGGAAQTHEAKGTWLDTKKANEKIEYGHKCGGAAPKRAGLAGVGGESSFRSKICSNC